MNRFLGDYHTHTSASDGKNSLSDLVEYAKANGFSEIAVTDHGYANVACALNDEKLKAQRAEADKLSAENPDLKIYVGVEADFVSFDGTLDLPSDDGEGFDVIIAGFHRFVKPKKASEWFRLEFYNGFLSDVFGTSKRLTAKNTDMVVAALERYDVDVFAHPGHYLKIDAERVGNACARRGTYVELNAKHLDKLAPYVADFLKTDCKFIACSDNHDVTKCKDMQQVLDFIQTHGIPAERVVNLGKVPTFKRHGGQNGKS